MAYRIEFAPAGQRSFQRLPVQLQRRIAQPIEALADNPRPAGVRKVVGQVSTWRIRVGDYRVVFEIDDERRLVVILLVGRRNEGTYRPG